MPLVELDEVKAYLGVEHTDDDDLLTQLESYCSEWVQGWLGRRVVPVGSPVAIVEYQSGGGEQLRVSSPPIATLTEVYDTIGDIAIPLSELAMNPEWGLIRFKRGGAFEFGVGRWRISYAGGLEITPAIKGGILRLIADFYQVRASVEGFRVGDISWSRYDRDLPPDVAGMLAPYRMVRF